MGVIPMIIYALFIMAAIRVPKETCYYDDRESYARELITDLKHPGYWLSPFAWRVLLSVFCSMIITFSVLKGFSVIALLTFILLFLIFYIIFGSMNGDNIAGSLPYATYPIPPHLGLDGISLVNRSTLQ